MEVDDPVGLILPEAAAAIACAKRVIQALKDDKILSIGR
jgi:hypothetical protein